jgi:hypothetical protein
MPAFGWRQRVKPADASARVLQVNRVALARIFQSRKRLAQLAPSEADCDGPMQGAGFAAPAITPFARCAGEEIERAAEGRLGMLLSWRNRSVWTCYGLDASSGGGQHAGDCS